MTAKCIVFAYPKGGTGKTTSCVNIAGELVRRGKKVLVVDMDPQANATSALGINRRYLTVSLNDALLGRCRSNKDIGLRDVVLSTEIDNLHLTPAEPDLSGFLFSAQKAKMTKLLDRALDDVRELYDYILVDTPPTYTPLLINAIAAADSIIMPLDSGYFSIDNIETFAEILREIEEKLGVKKQVNAVIVTRLQESRLHSLHRTLKKRIPEISRLLAPGDPLTELEDKLRMHLSIGTRFSGDLFIVPYSKRVYEAQKKGLPVSHHTSDGKIRNVYGRITEKIMNQV